MGTNEWKTWLDHEMTQKQKSKTLRVFVSIANRILKDNTKSNYEVEIT